ncbi:MAG: amidohydrolase family protein [candidate division WOR-3 bacterium]
MRDHCLPLDGLELDHSRLPTGVCSGMTHETIARVFKRMLPGEIKLAAFRFAAQKAVRRGVLSVGAMCGTDDQPSMAQPEVLDDTPELLVKHAPELPVDVVVYAQTRNIERVLRLGLPRIGGCILTDGSFGSRTAALHEAYYDAPSERGILYIQDEDLEDFFGSAHNKGLQVAVHAIGDRAVDQVVRCWNKVLDCRNRNSLRHRIEHAELLNTGLIQSIAELGLVLCVQPVFEQRWGGPSRMYATRLGSRYRLTNPWHELVKTGVVLAGGSDAPITPIDPIAGINAATSHPVVEHSVTRLQACRMFSDWAAYSLGIEHRKGSLTPGHDADFVHLSANPLETRDSRILRVFRSGTEVWAASSA